MPHTEQLFVRSKEKSLLLLMVKSSTAFDAKEKNKQMQKGQMTGICLKFNKTEHLIVVEEEMLEMKKKIQVNLVVFVNASFTASAHKYSVCPLFNQK